MNKETIGKYMVFFVGAALLASGGFKLFAAPPEVVEMMGAKLVPIAIIEILTVVAMFIPQTRMLGIILMASYLGGVIATEWLTIGETPIAGVALNTILYVGAALYRPWLTQGSAGTPA